MEGKHGVYIQTITYAYDSALLRQVKSGNVTSWIRERTRTARYERRKLAPLEGNPTIYRGVKLL